MQSLIMKKTARFCLFTLILLILFFSSCMKYMYIGIQGSADLNNGGHAVVVRIYQLRIDSNFINAPIDTFWNEGEDIIANDMTAPKIELILTPGETKQIDLEIEEETQFIGVAADFRMPDKTGWKQIHPVSSTNLRDLWVSVGSNRLIIQKY